MATEPISFLLETPRFHYLYDVNTNAIKKISPELYEALDNKRPLEGELADEFKAITDEGIAVPTKAETMMHPFTKFAKVAANRNMYQLILQVTQGCNLRCSYCSFTSGRNGRRHNAKRMSWETAKKALDFFLQHTVDREAVVIGFYGGEPLLEFGLIKKCVAYAEEIFEGKKHSYIMTTNATLLTDEIVDFLVEHKFQLTFSIDGPQELHDKNRKFAKDGSGSFNTVITNIHRLLKRHPEFHTNVSVNMVMDPQCDFDEFSRLFEDKDLLKGISVTPMIVDSYKLENPYYASDDFLSKQHYSDFLTLLNYFGYLKDTSSLSVITRHQLMSDLWHQVFGQQPSFGKEVSPSGPCAPICHRMMIATDGTILPCERVNELNPAMQLGNLDTGIDIEKVKALLNVAQLTTEECLKCFAFRHCKLCARYCDGDTELSREERLKGCESNRQYAMAMLSQRILLDEVYSYYNRFKIRGGSL